jgi:hypothetical protein
LDLLFELKNQLLELGLKIALSLLLKIRLQICEIQFDINPSYAILQNCNLGIAQQLQQ